MVILVKKTKEKKKEEKEKELWDLSTVHPSEIAPVVFGWEASRVHLGGWVGDDGKVKKIK